MCFSQQLAVSMYSLAWTVYLQVEAVLQSVAAHRASVPAVISKALEQQLQAMRPPGCAAALDDAAEASGASGSIYVHQTFLHVVDGAKLCLQGLFTSLGVLATGPKGAAQSSLAGAGRQEHCSVPSSATGL